MADLVVNDALKSQFSQFHEIAVVTGDLRAKLGRIDALNRTAGGQEDPFAKAYHKQIDEPTASLGQLVDSVRTLFGLTADGGNHATGLFDTGEGNATTGASQW